jgi:hypothetical protein
MGQLEGLWRSAYEDYMNKAERRRSHLAVGVYQYLPKARVVTLVTWTIPLPGVRLVTWTIPAVINRCVYHTPPC